MKYTFSEIELLQYDKVHDHFGPRGTFAVYLGKSPMDTKELVTEDVEDFIICFMSQFNHQIYRKF